MPPRSLDSLAFALAAAHDVDSALLALSDGLSEVERSAYVGLVRHDAKAGLLTELLSPAGPKVERTPLEVAFAHLPSTVAPRIAAGAEFVDAADQSREYARLLGIRALPEGGQLSLKGVLHEGQLAAVVVCYEAKRIFGARAIERFAPAVAVFELSLVRFLEREAREEAVRALEEVTRRVHAEHMAKLGILESQLAQARVGGKVARDSVALEREATRAAEELRRAQQRARALEHQVGAGTAQLEQAHVELHRRNELLRQRTRTLYLLERTLSLAATTDDPKALAEGLLSLIGDDLQAQRCSLFLKAPEPNALFLAAARGLSPHIKEGQRIKIGDGVAGKVAKTREPVLVVDTSDGSESKLLGDEYLTTGSFMSFPLVLHDDLVGVINLTNRAQRGLFVEEDVERVRLLGLVCSIASVEGRLAERLGGTPPRG
jgi:putative methionine-R-sulfoxide reductase with GAF domain